MQDFREELIGDDAKRKLFDQLEESWKGLRDQLEDYEREQARLAAMVKQ